MVLSTKRKRAEVSYAQEDEELDALLGIEEQNDGDDGEELLLDEVTDVSFGKKKAPKRKVAKLQATKRAKAAAQRTKKTKPFRFLDLPAELRDYIYELALTDDEIGLISKTKGQRRIVARGPVYNDVDLDVNVYSYARYSHGRAPRRRRLAHSQKEKAGAPPPNKLIPALLATNKQIHSEAITVLYRQEIIVEDTTALFTFLVGIGSNRRLLSNLTIRGFGTGRGSHKVMNFTALSLLADCLSLESLYFECKIVCLNKRAAEWLAKDIHREAHYFMEAFGGAKGRKDAALDILHFRDWEYEGMSDAFKQTSEEFQEQFRSILRGRLGC